MLEIHCGQSSLVGRILRKTTKTVKLCLKGQCHRLRISYAHSKLENLQSYFFKFMIQDGGHLRVSALQERQKFRHIDVNTRLMKLSKYWNRQHKSLYRFLYIFEAKSMINRDENGGLIKFTKRYQFRCPLPVVEIS